jgi:hypothetical protein
MKMTMFTDATVNGWLFTIAGLNAANGNTQPVPEPFLTTYVTDLNTPAPPATPTSSPTDIQANLENFPINANPPPANLITDTFFRTTVADFVLREFQLAWGVVPTSGSATSQYDAWVARVIDNPANMTAGGMSAALVGTPQFQSIFGTGATATAATITLLCAHAGVAVGPGAMANVGLPMAEVLQNFAENSTLVSNALAEPVANFQNLLLAGGTAPAGSILSLPGTPGASLTLTTGADTTTEGFSTGHGATATNAGAVFSALPGTNVLGPSNTLNAGDDLVATGAAAGDSTLNYTAVDTSFGNPAVAVGVTMTGVSAAVITNLSSGGAGFSGTITGLTTATLAAGSVGEVTLGAGGNGLNTALTTVNINASEAFTAFMTAAALAAAPSGTINLSGVTGPIGVALEVTGGATTGYGSLTINSNGSSANDIDLELGTATNTATITAAGAEALTLTGGAFNIDNLHTFTGNSTTTPPGPDTGGLTVTFGNADGLGHVDATGGSGVNTFIFGETAGGAPGFTSTSTVDGGTGTSNTLEIVSSTGAILVAGDGPNITGIATIEHAGAQTGALSADLALMGSATTFDLAGAYGGFPITVTDITDAMTVEYSATSSPLSLTLVHAAPVVATDVINFEMNSSLTTPLTLAQLAVAPGLSAVDIDSTGSASANIITDVGTVGDNITVTGATHLTLGSSGAGDAYAVGNGTINAVASTGGVTAWLSPTAGVAQTFVAGTGTNAANLVVGFGGGVIDFSHGGTDTVQFSTTQGSGFFLADTAHNYNDVVGFTAALDSVNISTSGIPTVYTDTAAPVLAGDATLPFDFTTGTSVSATTVHNNFIDITTPITSTGADTPQTAFATAIGTAATDGITVTGAAANVLLSYYDTTTSQAVLASATPVAGLISNASVIAVVGLIHESAADYGHIASNVHFVA